MFGIPGDTALAWANVILLSGLAIAAAGAIVAYQLGARMNAAYSLELQQVQSEAQTQIEILLAEVNTRTAGLVKVNEELQLGLQSERETRKAMVAQTRDITNEQMAKFVNVVKGKVRQINLFIAPNREASILGITILDALQKADVSVTWYRMKALPRVGQGIADSGVTIYEYPAAEKDESVGRTLAKALTAMDMQPNLLIPAQPLWEFPSPSLIIAPRPPEFLRASKDPIPSATKSAVLPDFLSHAEYAVPTSGTDYKVRDGSPALN
jgi:hypothetical protein